jgi:serine phosphatase RsbU (regulator of sigma subunit)
MSTGFPIGLEVDATWEQKNVQIHPGDVLVLYTDGIPEAQNGNGDFFHEKKIVEISKANLLQPAEIVQQEILKAVHEFMGDTPQMDDITLMVLVRNL